MAGKTVKNGATMLFVQLKKECAQSRDNGDNGIEKNQSVNSWLCVFCIKGMKIPVMPHVFSPSISSTKKKARVTSITWHTPDFMNDE